MTAPLRVGIAGLGTVGGWTLRLLTERRAALAAAAGRDIEVAAVSARQRGRDRGIALDGLAWHDDPAALARNPKVEAVVELIGGAEGPALATVEAALAVGKPVVTANKALLAAHGLRLAAMAEEAGVALAFEAAVGGGIPVVKTLREALVANRFGRVIGILNGTSNYILTRMEEDGLSFDAALAEAQRLGYAEADPSFDIGGHDTAHKLAILTSLAFGTAIDADEVYVEGIAAITPLDLAMAEELGYRIKLIGVAISTEAGIEQRVHPAMVPKNGAIARIRGVTNAVALDGDATGEITLAGAGAGGAATASAVVGDIVDVARGLALPPFGRPAAMLQPFRRAPMQRHAGGYYIRLHAFDRPGVFAGIAQRMAEGSISLESIVQRRQPAASADAVPVVLITHATTEAAVRQALDGIVADGLVAGQPQIIRIEKE
ncbi:MAG TPA: homoserine dehydrogenase [Hyphomicrobiales bacterium]|nr:homoserine dehydrogenase [Hyphomicrobiales bacterium]